jgi:hypothetical protein
MSYSVYPTESAAQADLNSVNAAYISTIIEVTGDKTAPPDDRVTVCWATVLECVEGFAFPCPPPCVNVALSGTIHESITIIEPSE